MQERTRTSPPAGDASMSTPSKPWDPLRQQVRSNVGQLFLPASALAKTSSTPAPLGMRDVPMSRPSTLPAQGDGMVIVSTAPPQTVQIQNQQHLLGKPQESLVLPVVATKDAVLLPQVPNQQTIITPALQVSAGAGNLGVSTVLPQSPVGLQKSVASNGSTPQMVLHQKQITDCLMRKNGVLGQPYKGRDQAAVSLETVVGHHSDIPLSSTPQNTLPLKTVTSDIGKVIDLISPEKVEEADGEMLTSRIETPKTKLLFENGGGNEQLENSTAGKIPVQKKDSLASKLSVFAFAKRESGTRELLQSDQVRAGTDSRDKRNVRYAQHRYRYGQKAGSDLDSNENFAYEGITEKTVPTSDDEEEEEERRKRMERSRENENGTPVLFDSEMGQLEDDLQGEELAQVCGRTDTTRCANADNVLPSNRQAHEEKEDADEEECEETLANRNFHHQKSDESNLKPAGRNTRLSSRGRRSLARRKDDASWQPEPPENGEGSAKGNRAKLSVRRSSRTSRRVGRNETTEENDKNADGADCCDVGVRCLQCDSLLVSHTQAMSGVTALSAEAVGRRYIQHQLTRRDGGDSASEPQHRDPCGCQRAGTVDRSEMVLVVATDAIHGCQSIGCDLGSDNMLQLNAHWSEEDSCCYCPITCAVCAGTTGLTAGDSRRRAVIGYSVMVAGDSSSGPEARNTYLPVRRLRCCDALLASTVAVKA
ncbi:uncharacterized protein [Diadema setosum]|uniref:uncharacterized protein n=1 Tax=Diadema setosum TaxID=31175 RepID=UPI003B3A8878